MEDVIIYSVGALVVRGLRRAVFGPPREEKLAEEVKQLQGLVAQQDSVIAQQSERLQQLEQALQLPAADAPQRPLALRLPGPSHATGQSSPSLKRSAPAATPDEAEISPKRFRWSLFPNIARNKAEGPAQPELQPSSPPPSNRIPAATLDTSSNPTSSGEEQSSSDGADTSASKSSMSEGSMDSETSCSDDETGDTEGTEEDSGEEEDSSEEEESGDEDMPIKAVPITAVMSGSESEMDASETSESESDVSEAGSEEGGPSLEQGTSNVSSESSDASTDASSTSSESTSPEASLTEEDSKAGTEANSYESSGKSEGSSHDSQGNQDNHGPADADAPYIDEAIKEALSVFSCEQCGKISRHCGCDKAAADPAVTEKSASGASEEQSSDESDISNDSDPVAVTPTAAEPVQEDQTDLALDAEQAAVDDGSSDQEGAADEVAEGEAEEVEEGIEGGGDGEGEEHNHILSQVQEQIATAIYGLHLGDATLGQEEILSDLHVITVAIQPQSPDGAPQEAPHGDQPPPSIDDIASPVVPGAELAAYPAEKQGGPSSELDGVPFEMLDAPAASSYDLAAQPLTAASVDAGGHSGDQSQSRRSPKRAAAEELEMDDWQPRRRRKRPRTLCMRLLAILPRPLRRLTRFGGRAYWRGVRRPTSSTSGSSQDQEIPEPESPLEGIVNPTEAEAQASGGQADGGFVFQAGIPATQEPMQDHVEDDVQDEASDGVLDCQDMSQDEPAAEDAAGMEPGSQAGLMTIGATGIFQDVCVAYEDALHEEELALLAQADAEAQARLMRELARQDPRSEDMPGLGPPMDDDSDSEDMDDNEADTSAPSSPQDMSSGNERVEEPLPAPVEDTPESPIAANAHRYGGMFTFGAAHHSRAPSPRRQHLSHSRSQGEGILTPVLRRSSSRIGRSASRSVSQRSGSSYSRSRSSSGLSRSLSRRARSENRSPGSARSSSPGYELQPSHSLRRSFRRSMTPSRGGSAQRASRSRSPEASRERRSGHRYTTEFRFGRSLSPAGHARSRSPSRASPSADCGRFSRLSPSPARSNSSSRSPSRHSRKPRNGDVTYETESGSPARSPCRKAPTEDAEGELRQLVRECENLEAVASPRAVARVAELSPLLSQPGGRKRGVLLSPSRSPIPRGHVLDDISADQEEGGGRLTGSPENGYWLVGEGDREEPDFLAAKRLTASQLYNDLADNYHPDDENLDVAFSPPRLGSDLDAAPDASDRARRRFSSSPSLRSPRGRSLVRSRSRSVVRPRSRQEPSRSRSRSASPNFAWTSRAARTNCPEPPSPPPRSVERCTAPLPRPGTPVPVTRGEEEPLGPVGNLRRLERSQTPSDDEDVPPVADPSSPVSDDHPTQETDAALEDLDAPVPNLRAHVSIMKPSETLPPRSRHLETTAYQAQLIKEREECEARRKASRMALPTRCEDGQARVPSGVSTGSSAIEAPQEPESVFQRNMRFAQRIFEAHKARADARRAAAAEAVTSAEPPAVRRPLSSVVGRDAAARRIGARNRVALAFAKIARPAPAWMPMANFGFDNPMVEETVDLTQDDNDEEELPAAPAQGGRASTGGMDSSGEADLDAMPLF